MAPAGTLCRGLALAALWLPTVWLGSLQGLSIHKRDVPGWSVGAVACLDRCVNGYCSSGKCRCFYGYTGPTCSEVSCEKSCDHGYCSSGKCRCDLGYKGVNCSEEVPCSPSCENGGTCLWSGFCHCADGYTGPTCEIASNPCRWGCVNGTCTSGICQCDVGYTGLACDQASNPCRWGCVHGTCTSYGLCQCDVGYTGLTCNQASNVCRWGCVHGTCTSGICQCDMGYTGLACDQDLSSSSTQGDCVDRCVNGECQGRTCVCHAGYSGDNCDNRKADSWVVAVCITAGVLCPIILSICIVIFLVKGCFWKWECYQRGCRCDCISKRRDKKMLPAVVEENVYENIAVISRGKY